MGIWKIPASIPNVTSWSKRAAGAVAIMLTFLPADERTKGTCILFKKLSQSLYIPETFSIPPPFLSVHLALLSFLVSSLKPQSSGRETALNTLALPPLGAALFQD